MRGFPSSLLCLALLVALMPAPAGAQKATIDQLCLRHGIQGEDSVARIRKAYVKAVSAGVTEEELTPFVEDILRHKLDCAQMVRVLEATARLRKENLPYFVVFSKVREGVAKEAPPALVVEAAEGKLKTLIDSRDVLKSLESSGFQVRDFQNAAVIVSSYLEKGYAPGEVVLQIRRKGIEGAGFAALSGVVEKSVQRKER